jgi:FkbM family methyltransferase
VAYYDELAGYYPNCELPTKRWCVENAQPDWTWFDCGANIGYYSLLFARLSPRGRVFAFEPTRTHAMLRENLEHHGAGNVVAEKLALGRASGTAQAALPRVWGHATDRGAFPFTTVDDYVEQHALARVDCIKVDVDSYDFDVLLGAEKTLDRFDPWIVAELTDVALALRQQFTTDVLRWLATKGYSEGRVLEHTNYLFRRGGSGAPPDAPRLTLAFER